MSLRKPFSLIGSYIWANDLDNLIIVNNYNHVNGLSQGRSQYEARGGNSLSVFGFWGNCLLLFFCKLESWQGLWSRSASCRVPDSIDHISKCNTGLLRPTCWQIVYKHHLFTFPRYLSCGSILQNWSTRSMQCRSASPYSRLNVLETDPGNWFGGVQPPFLPSDFRQPFMTFTASPG